MPGTTDLGVEDKLSPTTSNLPLEQIHLPPPLAKRATGWVRHPWQVLKGGGPVRTINTGGEVSVSVKNTEDYHNWLLSQLIESSDMSAAGFCVLHGSCGKILRVPFFLLCAAWQGLSEIVSMRSCCLDTIDIFLPDVEFESLEILKDLVTTGSSAIIGSDTEKGVQSLITNYMRDWSVEKLFQKVSDPSQEVDENQREDCAFQNVVENIMFGQSKKVSQPVQTSQQIGLESFCSRHCANSCSNVLKTWPAENVRKLNGMFKSDKLIESKIKLLNHLKSQNTVGLSVTSFIVNGHEFCLKFFAHTIGCSFYIVESVLKDFHSGIEQYQHGNAGCLQQETPATTGAICWLKSFGEAYGQFSPEENVTVLSYWLKKQFLFKMYLDETAAPHISQSLFYEIFKTKFGHHRLDKTLPWLRISKYSTHSVCSICVALNNNHKQCKTEAEIKQATALKNNHRINFGLARRKVEEVKQSAISFPSDNLFLQIDGMDNSKSYLPRYLELSKDQVQKERLPSKISGCTIYNGWYEENRKVLFYINHDIFENGSNMIITIVYLLIQEFLKDHNKLPRKLHLNMDNCWKENKNRFVFSFLASLLELKIFEEISCNYLMVGHTGNEVRNQKHFCDCLTNFHCFQVDQLFSILCKQFKDDITTLEVLKEKITSAPIIPKPICRSLDFIYDWKMFITDKLTNPPMKYQSKYNSFLLSVEILEGKRCVMLRGKKLPQDTQLVPRSGIRVIREDVEFEPVGPAEYRIDKINFDEIMKGLSIFLRKLPLQEKMTISTSWDRLRDKLENLPNRSENFPKMKLKDLPKQLPEVLQVPDYLMDGDEDGIELTGDKYPENIDEGDLDSEISVGMDVCVYTEEKRGRPWVGRVLQLLEDQRFLIHWFTRKTIRSKTFYALTNNDGSPSISEQENGTVMFWQMSENRTQTSFSLSNFWLETIVREYESLDGE